MTSNLRIDWQACQGRGLCHELLPEHIALDEWGFPILHGPIEDRDLRDARAAVRACPMIALRLTREE